LLNSLLGGCGSSSVITESDSPRVSLQSVSRTPSILRSEGGKIDFTVNLWRTYGTYLIAPANNPTFSISDGNKVLLDKQPLIFLSRDENRAENDYSGRKFYCASKYKFCGQAVYWHNKHSTG
jgi:hypothetical protein